MSYKRRNLISANGFFITRCLACFIKILPANDFCVKTNSALAQSERTNRRRSMNVYQQMETLLGLSRREVLTYSQAVELLEIHYLFPRFLQALILVLINFSLGHYNNITGLLFILRTYDKLLQFDCFFLCGGALLIQVCR